MSTRAIGFTIIILWPAISVAETFTANQASKHIGETATICGIVASTNFAKQAKGQPTFLNLERPYPNESVTLVTWGENRPRFGTPESTLLQQRACATGVIELYRGRPQVILRDPDQLKQE